MKRKEIMNKGLGELFRQDNKRIDESTQTQLNVKINKAIKNRRLIKGIIFLLVAIIGAAIFSWSLSLIMP